MDLGARVRRLLFGGCDISQGPPGTGIDGGLRNFLRSLLENLEYLLSTVLQAQEGQGAEIFGISKSPWRNSKRGVEYLLVDGFRGYSPLVVFHEKTHRQETVDHQMYQEKSHEVLGDQSHTVALSRCNNAWRLR